MFVHIYRFALNVYTCSTKTRDYEIHQRKYSFWLQKVVKNNLNIISKKFRGDTYNLFHEFISRITFLYDFLGKSRKKAKIPFLVTKTRQNSKKNNIFENFGGWLYNDSALIFDDKSLWKDLQPKAYFSLAFYA